MSYVRDAMERGVERELQSMLADEDDAAELAIDAMWERFDDGFRDDVTPPSDFRFEEAVAVPRDPSAPWRLERFTLDHTDEEGPVLSVYLYDERLEWIRPKEGQHPWEEVEFFDYEKEYVAVWPVPWLIRDTLLFGMRMMLSYRASDGHKRDSGELCRREAYAAFEALEAEIQSWKRHRDEDEEERHPRKRVCHSL